MASELRVNSIKNRSGLGTVTFADEGLLIAGITSLSLGNTTLIVGSATSTGTANQTLQVTGGGYVSGNTGIGTTNPTSKLSVTGDVIITGGNLLVGTSSSTGTTLQPLQVTGGAYVSSFVGIGTTNPTRQFHILGSTTSSEMIMEQAGAKPDFKKWNFVADSGNSTTASNLNLRLLNDAGTATTKMYWIVNGTNNTQSFYDTVLVGSTTSTGTANQTLQVTGGGYISGNVGIGYTNPGAKLTVAGNLTLGRTDSVNEGGQINFNRSVDDGFAYAIDVYGNTAANSRLRFIDATSGAERVTLDRAGNFIVGTSSSTGTASQPLQVTGGAYVSGSFGIGVTNPSYTLTVSGNSGTDAALISGIAGAAYFGAVGNKPVIFENNGTEKLRIAANGDINMGSASNPGDTLRYFDIYNTNTGNSAGSILRLITNNPSNSGTTSANLLLYRTGDLYLTNYSTGSVRLGNGASGTDRLVIDSSGRITMPSQVYVYATSGTVSGTPNPVSPPHYPFTTYSESYDIGSNFNASTGVFTAPITGKYLIMGTWSQDANTGRSIGTLSFNGNYEEWVESNNQYNDVTGARVRVLAANDTVSFGRQGSLASIAISIWLLG